MAERRVAHPFDPACPACAPSPGMMRFVAAHELHPDAPAPFENPVDHGTTWAHGTGFEPERTDSGRDEGGELDPDAERFEDEESGGSLNGRGHKHWNTDLGTHFTALPQVARELARHTGMHARVAHASLHMANPKRYESEYDMDRDAIGWARSHGHKFLPENDADHERFVGGHFAAMGGRHEWELMGLSVHRPGPDTRQAISKIDREGVIFDKGTYYNEQWLRHHPDRDRVATGFERHLRDQGHDGIIYGNEYEGPRGHASAIAFRDTPVTLHRWDWLNRTTAVLGIDPIRGQNDGHGRREAGKGKPRHDAPQLDRRTDPPREDPEVRVGPHPAQPQQPGGPRGPQAPQGFQFGLNEHPQVDDDLDALPSSVENTYHDRVDMLRSGQRHSSTHALNGPLRGWTGTSLGGTQYRLVHRIREGNLEVLSAGNHDAAYNAAIRRKKTMGHRLTAGYPMAAEVLGDQGPDEAAQESDHDWGADFPQITTTASASWDRGGWPSGTPEDRALMEAHHIRVHPRPDDDDPFLNHFLNGDPDFGVLTVKQLGRDETVHTLQQHLHRPALDHYRQHPDQPFDRTHEDLYGGTFGHSDRYQQMFPPHGVPPFHPVVATIGGQKWVTQGHHRILASRMNGDPSIPYWHLDVDKDNRDMEDWYAKRNPTMSRREIREHFGLDDELRPRQAGVGTIVLTRQASDDDYRMQHTAPDEESGIPLHEPEAHFPDIYQHPEWYRGATGADESLRALQRARGNPEARVRIYRAIPAEHAHQGIRTGDWVSTSPSYAREHATQSHREDDWPVIATTVPAKHLYSAGDVTEWGYTGPHREYTRVHFKGGRNQEVRQHADGVVRKVVRRTPKEAAASGFSENNRFAERLDNEPDLHEQFADHLRDYTAPTGHGYRLLHDLGAFTNNTVTAHQRMSNGKYKGVGYLSWFGGKPEYDGRNTDGGVIYKVHVSAPHQRRGIASAMLDFARERKPEQDIRHSTALTDEGRAWAEKTAMGMAGPDYDNLTFHHMTGFEYGAHPDIHHHQLLFAGHPDHGYVGKVHYEQLPDMIHIHNLTVYPDHQRRGVGSQLMAELERRHPGVEINHGVRTPEGTQWAKSFYGHEGPPLVGDDGWSLAQNTRDHQLVASRRSAQRILPHKRLFGPTYGLDKRLWTPQKTLKPDVRKFLLRKVGSFFLRHYGPGWDQWARVYFAGSEASMWTDADLIGNSDFDTLIGIDYAAMRKAVPALAHASNRKITDLLNSQYRAELNDPAEMIPVDGELTGPWDATFYTNLDSWDIKAIKPYAAYDVGADRWAVEPYDDATWDLSKFPKSFVRALRGAEDYARDVLALPEPQRTQQGAALFEAWHSDRSRAFSPHGEGWYDFANAREKWLDQLGVWAQLVDCAHRAKQGLDLAPADWSNTPKFAAAKFAASDKTGLPIEPDLYWRFHHPAVPLDAEHARSRHWGTSSKEELDQRGFSSFQHPRDLHQYLHDMDWTTEEGKPEVDFDERRIVGFHGDLVGRGIDGEDLVVPRSGSPAHEMSYAQFDRRIPHTPTQGTRWDLNQAHYGSRATDAIEELGRQEHPNVDHYQSGGIGHRDGDESRSVVGFMPVSGMQRYREHAGDWNGAHSQETVEKIRQDIRDGIGIRTPLTVHYCDRDKWGYIGEGNHRLRAAAEEGLHTVPVRVVRREDLSHQKERGIGAPMDLKGKFDQRTGPYVPSDIHPYHFLTARQVTGRSDRLERVWGSHELDALFNGSPTSAVPFPPAGRRKDRHEYDKDLVTRALTHPEHHQMREVDPRILRATQPSVTRAGVAHYLGDHYERTGETYADMHNPGNRRPVVYHRKDDDQFLLLSGHHRATAKLLRGEPLQAVVVEGPWGASRG